MKDDDILREAKEEVKTCIDGWSKNIELSRDDIRFLNNDQWPDKTKREREAEGRPCLTFDHLNQSVRQVIGDIRQNSPSIKIRPVENDNEKVPNVAGTKDYSKADVYEGIIRNIEYSSNASIAYDTAAEQAVRGGFGFIRLLTEYSDDSAFEQDIKIKRVRNQYSVYLDPDFTEPDGSDANFGYVIERITKDEFERRYPKKESGDFERNAGDHYWYEKDHVRIAERFKRVPVKKTICLMSNGEVMDKEKIEPIIDELAQDGITVVRERIVQTYKVMWSKISGASILEGPKEFPSKYIPIIPVLGEELIVDGEPVYKSAIRDAKDAQRAYNYSRSAHIELSSLAPKAPFLIGTSQLKGGLDKYWSTANTKNHSYLPYNDQDNNSVPSRNMGVQVQPGLVQESMQAADDIKAATGIYDASLGARSNEASGRAILARQREGDISTFAFSDNLSRSIQHIGRILVDMIPKVYDSTRIMRLRFQDDSEDFVEINKTVRDLQTGKEFTAYDLSYGKFDAVVTVGASYTTQRMEGNEALLQATQANPNLWNIVGDLIFKNMDWPGADEISKRMRKTIAPQLLEADSEEAQQAQMQAQEPTIDQRLQEMNIKAQMGKNEASVMKSEADMMKAQADKAEAELQMHELQAKVQNMEGLLEEILGAINAPDTPAPNGAFFMPE